jgi:hypothetical protein
VLRRDGVDRSLLRETGVRDNDVDDTLFLPYGCGDMVEVIELRGIGKLASYAPLLAGLASFRD